MFNNQFYQGKLNEFTAQRQLWLDNKSPNELGKGAWVLEHEQKGKVKRFVTLQEVQNFLYTLKGKTAVMQENIVGWILIEDGKVVGYSTEYGMNDDYVKEHWLGEPIEKEEEPEKTRYSIYDVYSTRELL